MSQTLGFIPPKPTVLTFDARLSQLGGGPTPPFALPALRWQVSAYPLLSSVSQLAPAPLTIELSDLRVPQQRPREVAELALVVFDDATTIIRRRIRDC